MPLSVVFRSASEYTYGDASHKHAVTNLATGESYTYDADGNMITRVEGGVTYTQTFDAENRLISITAGGLTTSFVYDGDGNLVKKIKTDGSKTLYVGGVYEVNKNSGGTVTGTVTYYPAAGAMRVNSTLYFVLKDHLGSASVVTDATGTTVGEDRFYPFGETRFTTGTMFTDKLFTGQREITGLGIYYFGARYYSPKLGRFLSADSIVPGAANPQNLNRYSYVMNNPLRYIDPSGHKCVSAGPGDCLNDNGRPINGAGGLTPKKKKPGNDGGDKPGCGIDGTGAYGFHCTKKDIDGVTLQQRLDWFKWLTNNMNENIRPDASDWFKNIRTVLAGFVATGQDDNEWVLNVDANILLAIQDGYVSSIGHYTGTPLDANSGAGLWQQFFNSLKSPNVNVTDDTLIEQWGKAEQAGTNEGLQGTDANAGWDDQFFTFVGNIYRGAGGSWCQTRTCVGGFFDPRSTSLFDVQLGFSPVALAQLPVYFFDTFGYAFTGH